MTATKPFQANPPDTVRAQRSHRLAPKRPANDTEPGSRRHFSDVNVAPHGRPARRRLGGRCRQAAELSRPGAAGHGSAGRDPHRHRPDRQCAPAGEPPARSVAWYGVARRARHDQPGGAGTSRRGPHRRLPVLSRPDVDARPGRDGSARRHGAHRLPIRSSCPLTDSAARHDADRRLQSAGRPSDRGSSAACRSALQRHDSKQPGGRVHPYRTACPPALPR